MTEISLIVTLNKQFNSTQWFLQSRHGSRQNFRYGGGRFFGALYILAIFTSLEPERPKILNGTFSRDFILLTGEWQLDFHKDLDRIARLVPIFQIGIDPACYGDSLMH